MHIGDVNDPKSKSKTEAMFIPGRDSEASIEEATANYEVEEGTSFVSFCEKFKYLGVLLTPDLDDTHDIKRRINLGMVSF